MSARDEILARVRGATADVVTTPADRAPTAVVEEASPGRAATLDLFAENVADYRAQVVRVPTSGVAEAVTRALKEQGCATAVLPTGLDPAWRGAAAEVVRVLDEADVAVDAELDAVDAVVTAAAVGIAVTGTSSSTTRPTRGAAPSPSSPTCTSASCAPGRSSTTSPRQSGGCVPSRASRDP